MRQWVNGKWKKNGTRIPYTYVQTRYYPLSSSGLQIVTIDQAADYWIIGKEVQIDIWIQYAFADECNCAYMSGDGTIPGNQPFVSTSTIVVTLKNIQTGGKASKIFNMPSIGMSAQEGSGIIPLRFYPEEMGLSTGRWALEMEIEAQANYQDFGPYLISGSGSCPFAEPKNDSNSVEKNGDRPVETLVKPFYYIIDYKGETNSDSQAFWLTIASSQPVADFSADPMSGNAPLQVAFTNLSQAEDAFPITSSRWYFGDSGYLLQEGAPNDYVVPHIYETPGTYSVRLVVTNSMGSSEKNKQITVGAGAVQPIIVDDDATYLPQACYQGQSVVLEFHILNNGGAGNIWLKSTCKGVNKTLIASIALPAYAQDFILTMPAHNLEWYAGYKPALDEAVSILFEVGPVGGSVSDNRTWETFETSSGDGADECADGFHWDEETQTCVADEGTSSKWWIIGGAGAAAAVAGLLMLVTRKKKPK
jgi:PKD repeat protein